MLFKRNILLVVLVWALLGTTNALAQAHQHGDHQHQQNSVVSPFDSPKGIQSLHCLLRGHSHQVFCPHSKPDSAQTTNIATDCGGKTSGAIPNSTSFSSEFAEINFLSLIHHSPGTKLAPSIVRLYLRFTDSLDPPPRFI